MARRRLGELLVEQGRIDHGQVQAALAYQKRTHVNMGQALLDLGYVEEPVLLATLSRQLGVSYMELGDRIVPASILALVPPEVMRRRKVLPLALLSENRRGPLVVAMAEPGNMIHLDEVAFATGKAIRPVLASDRDVERALRRHGILEKPPAPLAKPSAPSSPSLAKAPEMRVTAVGDPEI
jgi:hypothetical protein